MAAVTLRELRLTNGAHVKLPSPVNPLASVLLSVGRVTGDYTGQLRAENRTAVVVGVVPAGGDNGGADVVQTDNIVTLIRQLTQPSLTYVQTRQYSVIDATTPSSSITGEAGSLISLPPSLAVNYSTIDVAGYLSGASGPVTLSGGAKLFLRPTAVLAGAPSASVSVTNVSIGSGCAFSVEMPVAFAINNLTAVGASIIALGSTTRAVNPSFAIEYLSTTGTGSTIIGNNVLLNATYASLSGGAVTVGTGVTIRSSSFAIAGATSVSTGGGLLLAASATAAPSGWPMALGAQLTGIVAVRSTPLMTTAHPTTIVADDSIALSGTLTWTSGGALSLQAAAITIPSTVTIDGTGGGYTSTTLGPGSGTPCVTSASGLVPYGGAHSGCGSRSTNCTLLGYGLNGRDGAAYGSVSLRPVACPCHADSPAHRSAPASCRIMVACRSSSPP